MALPLMELYPRLCFLDVLDETTYAD